jgi:hypothetical protein
MADGLRVKVTKTGRVRGPNLSDPQLKIIGEQMLAAQKQRWAQGLDADGLQAKPLSKQYAVIKQKAKGNVLRNMSFTGKTVENFSLRKAADGKIRAENTTRLERAKAQRSQSYDQMIGFAVSDIKVVMNESQKQYQEYVKTAWIPLGSTRGRPR